MNNNTHKILAYLFTEAGSVSFTDLAKYFDINIDQVKNSITEIKGWATQTPFTLVETETEVAFVLNTEMSQALAELDKKEGERELTKASTETLSIILYKGGATRADIDYIRGVNSAFSLRSLVSKGYIERGSKNTYIPTADLLIFLGINNINDLPEREDILKKLEEVTNQKNDID